MKISHLISFLFIPVAFAHTEGGSWSSDRPDSHAPIGVMGEHIHKAGEFMLSYRYMFMRMEDNYDGSDSIANTSFAGPPPAPFRVAPIDMDMEMHTDMNTDINKDKDTHSDSEDSFNESD